MRFLRPKPKTEKQIQNGIVLSLLKYSFSVVDKTHGDIYSSGWPDLYAFRPALPSVGRTEELHRWIEVKRPGGKLTPGQRHRFERWERAHLGVWILSSTDISPIFGPSNWREWL